MNRSFRKSCALLLVIYGLVCVGLFAATLNITHVDLFSMKDWNSKEVSVEGMRLGMNLGSAISTLSQRGLRLFDDATRLPCTAKSHTCYVARRPTDGGTVDVALQNGGSIAAINIGIPEDPATLPQTIAGRFKGATRELFFHYTDKLREELLGAADQTKRGEQTRFMRFATYSYCRLGVRFYTEQLTVRRSSTPSSVELMSVEFFLPGRGCAGGAYVPGLGMYAAFR